MASVLLLVASTFADGGHNHDDHSENHTWRWAGTFETPADTYVWTSQSKGTGYQVPSTKIVVLPTAAKTFVDALHALEPVAEHSLNATNCVSVRTGSVMTPAVNQCYLLHFNMKLHTSIFEVDTTNVDHIAIFAERKPTDFERDMHYLKDVLGTDIEPVAELPETMQQKKPWGEAIGAAILVLLCTFVGIVFLGPSCNRLAKRMPLTLGVLTNAFAAGALLAAAFCLMLYEATHLIVQPDEAAATAWWGSAILLGFITASLLELGVTSVVMSAHDAPAHTDTGAAAKADPEAIPVDVVSSRSNPEAVTAGSTPSAPARADSGMAATADSEAVTADPESITVSVVKVPHPSRRTRVLSGVILGDFMHNVVDGLFIGAAFTACDRTMAWSITAATIYHELAQELSDYLVLTDPQQGGLKPSVALLLNFISGLSVMLGVLIILAQESPHMFSQGIMLAFGGGVYVQIGATECMARVHEHARHPKLLLAAILSFALGAIAIGLVLLDHEHCGGDAHHH